MSTPRCLIFWVLDIAADTRYSVQGINTIRSCNNLVGKKMLRKANSLVVDQPYGIGIKAGKVTEALFGEKYHACVILAVSGKFFWEIS